MSSTFVRSDRDLDEFELQALAELALTQRREHPRIILRRRQNLVTRFEIQSHQQDLERLACVSGDRDLFSDHSRTSRQVRCGSFRTAVRGSATSCRRSRLPAATCSGQTPRSPIRGLGLTPPLFRLTMPRVTENACWIVAQIIFVRRGFDRRKVIDSFCRSLNIFKQRTDSRRRQRPSGRGLCRPMTGTFADRCHFQTVIISYPSSTGDCSKASRRKRAQ